ncbi:hypothetical protein AYI70_g4742 [Smittium culicis]|uniref:Uncharacterized protein n=1 Tax=Smittium culicis TaxID=133412 RepID=A0A1R1XXL2_9FUNG|nr:hypothetical protein AYI70_g4742 [Smittium culicis]
MDSHFRLKNMHSKISLARKPKKVVESDAEPLKDRKKTVCSTSEDQTYQVHDRRRPFRGNQKFEGRQSPVSFFYAIASINGASTTRLASNSSRGGREGLVGGKGKESMEN